MNTEISGWYNTSNVPGSNVRAIKPFRWPRWLYRPVNNLWWRESWGNSVYTRPPSFEFQFRWLRVKPSREKRREREKQSESFFSTTMRSIENEEVIQTGRCVTLVCISWWEQWFISEFSSLDGRRREKRKGESFLIFVCIGFLIIRLLWLYNFFFLLICQSFMVSKYWPRLEGNFEENELLYLFWNL